VRPEVVGRDVIDRAVHEPLGEGIVPSVKRSVVAADAGPRLTFAAGVAAPKASAADLHAGRRESVNAAREGRGVSEFRQREGKRRDALTAIDSARKRHLVDRRLRRRGAAVKVTLYDVASEPGVRVPGVVR